MKKRLLLPIPLLAITFSALSPFFANNKVGASIVTDAQAFCASQDYASGTPFFTACTKGYGKEKNNEQQGGITKERTCGTGGGTHCTGCNARWDGADGYTKAGAGSTDGSHNGHARLTAVFRT